MIVDEVRTREHDGAIERSAVIHSARGELELSIAAPVAIADRSDDASGFLCATLPLAMRLGEDLQIVGPVSRVLHERIGEIQALYLAWAPFMRRIEVDAVSGSEQREAREQVAYLSRGVDSVFAAARDRAGDCRFSCLVFADGLEPIHDDAVRATEIARARAVAARLDLPVAVARTNLRALSDPIIRDWEDMCGAGLSFVAHALAGGVRSVHIPSSDTYMSVEPAGTSPLLDPLFSTERVRIEHGSLEHSRVEKVRWLATHRPDLIADLKVCYSENRFDNCGRCGKCMITMAALHLTGALQQALLFPPALDYDAIAAMRLTVPKALIDWAEIAMLDDDRAGGALRDAVTAAIRNSVRRGHEYESEGGSLWIEPRSFRTHRLNLLLSLLIDGEVYPRRP